MTISGDRMVLELICGVAAGAVLLTKAADLWTTWKHVSAETETNPIGRFLFRRLGMAGGLAAVATVTVLVVAATWATAVELGVGAMTLAAALSLFVSLVQGGVALHNATGRSNAVTRKVAALHAVWAAAINRRNRS